MPVSFLIFFLIRYFRSKNHAFSRAIILKKYNIHRSVSFWESTKIYGTGKINIGENTYIGRESFINAHPNDSKIIIGKRCAISHGVHIRTGGYEIETFSSENRKNIYDDIYIGDNVWIGAHVFIKGGVKVGSNVIIGANSVVVKDIPDNSVVGGVPSKVLKSI